MEISVGELLRKALQDEVIVFQTDTVYGIGCLLNSEAAVKHIYEIKKRDGQKPLAVLCSSFEEVLDLVEAFPSIKELANTYWPGALTLICKKSKQVPSYVARGLDTIGIRIPDDPIALAILERFGPMVVTSLNIATEPAIVTYREALTFEKKVDYIVVGTDCKGTSSTVYDPIQKMVYRQGDVTVK